jgi:hypothetical protein
MVLIYQKAIYPVRQDVYDPHRDVYHPQADVYAVEKDVYQPQPDVYARGKGIYPAQADVYQLRGKDWRSACDGTFAKPDDVLNKFSSLSSLKGGEGRGEEAKTITSSVPLTPTLPRLGGERESELPPGCKSAKGIFPQSRIPVHVLSVFRG